jgi:hypothetical protein
VDRAIREAQERGEFDNLTTAGKPLQLGKPWDPDWGMAHHILKQAGETLPWIALDKEIRERRDRLWAQLERAAADLRETAGQPGRWERRRVLRERYLKDAEELDKLMAEFNHQVPIRRLDKGRLPPHIAAERFDKACPPGNEVPSTES